MKKITILLLILIFLTLFACKKDKGYTIQEEQVGNIKLYNLRFFLGEKELIYPMRNRPGDVKNISIEKGIAVKLIKKQVYITQDIELVNKTKKATIIAPTEFGRILGNRDYGIYGLNVNNAVIYSTNDTEAAGLPVIDCNSVNNDLAVVKFVEGNENKIYSEGECVILEAVSGSDFIRVADRLAYSLLNID